MSASIWTPTARSDHDARLYARRGAVETRYCEHLARRIVHARLSGTSLGLSVFDHFELQR